MRIARTFATTAAVALLGSLATTTATATPRDLVIEGAPDKVTLDLKAMNGSGCKAGTAWAGMTNGNTAININYSDFTATIGDGEPRGNFRKNCQLTVGLEIPAGYTYAVNTIRHQGYVEVLGDGQKARLTTNYYFQGDNNNADLYTDWYPWYDDNFDIKHVRTQEELVWSPCGAKRMLNINTAIRLEKGDDRSDFAMITLDSSRVKSKTLLNLSWKRC